MDREASSLRIYDSYQIDQTIFYNVDMVCDKCEKKLTKVIVPDKWKDGARNTVGGKDGGQKIAQNMKLKKKPKSNR